MELLEPASKSNAKRGSFINRSEKLKSFASSIEEWMPSPRSQTSFSMKPMTANSSPNRIGANLRIGKSSQKKELD